MTHRYNPEAFEPFDEWYESVYDDACTIAALMGWDISPCDIQFSGFWSQGDGASFTGTLGYKAGCARAVREYAPQDETLHDIASRWQELQRKHGYRLHCDVTRVYGAGNYVHENTVTGESYIGDDSYNSAPPASDDAALDIARDFMRWIYRSLEREYEFQQAWNMASAWDNAEDEAIASRAAARQALRDYRTLIASKCAPTLPDSVKRAAKAAIRAALTDWQECLEKRATLADEFHYWQDGESVDIATFAKDYV